MQKYTILRDLNRKTSRRETTRSGPSPADFTSDATRSVETPAPEDLPAPEIETTSLSDRDLQDAANDPEVAGVALVMPTILLAPVALEAEEAGTLAEGDSWGIAAVGAVGRKAGKPEAAWFSNTMPTVSAPGVAIRSAKSGGGLADMDGTSMATPHVAGIAALWWEHLRATSPDGSAAAADVAMRMTVAARQQDVFAGPTANSTMAPG